jgi:CRISPR/Cas system-associated exonuclease Cas4 (RecB family)
MIDFDGMITKYIKKEFRPRGIGKYYPSDAGMCMRKVWYSYMYPSEVEPELAKIFELGNIIHDFIVKVLKSEKNREIVLLGSELPVRQNIDGIEISGRVDDVIKVCIDNKVYLVEVKSTKSLFYTNDAKSHNVDQLQLYMHLTGIHDGIILYVDKTNLQTKAFKISYDPSAANEIIERFKKLHSHLLEKTLPPPEAKLIQKNAWMCKYCEYQDKCLKNES